MCPVCGARFRGAAVCPRCGADLTVLMRLQVRAYRLREAARRALLEGDAARARAAAAEAQRLHRTAAGRRLERLAAWLEAVAARQQ
jgi:hypothetical protein